MKKEDDKRVREDKTESQKLEKKLFAITAVLMCVLGAVLGLYAVEFLSEYFPKTNKVQYTLTCAITATILALVMLSLSKPVCKLLKMFMEKMQTSLSTRPVYKSMSVVFGIIFGISSAILSGVALSVFVPSLPGVMYVFIIAIVFVVFTYIATVVFGKILGANAGSAVDYHRGYVIASSAFQSDKVVRLVPKLIGKIAVMDVTVSILSDKLTDAKMEGEDTSLQQKAFDNYMQLKKIAFVQLANGDPTRSETENLASLAHSRKLKIIALEKLELFDDNDVDVLYLSEI